MKHTCTHVLTEALQNHTSQDLKNTVLKRINLDDCGQSSRPLLLFASHMPGPVTKEPTWQVGNTFRSQYKRQILLLVSTQEVARITESGIERYFKKLIS